MPQCMPVLFACPLLQIQTNFIKLKQICKKRRGENNQILFRPATSLPLTPHNGVQSVPSLLSYHNVLRFKWSQPESVERRVDGLCVDKMHFQDMIILVFSVDFITCCSLSRLSASGLHRKL